MDREEPLSFREKLADWLTHAQFYIYCVLVLSLLLVGFLWHRTFFIVPAGNMGVVYRPLHGGTDTKNLLREGLHILVPWNYPTMYDVRLQQQTLDFKVLSDEGLSLSVQVVVRFRPNATMLGHLHKEIGPDYFERLIKPEIESHVRKVFGNRPAHELYATVREVLQELGHIAVQGRIETTERGPVSFPYVQLQDVKLVIIELPKIVENAILEKYQQEQLMLAYKYKLEREQKEADRKRTEAAGIRDFAQIAGKSADVMRWRGLEVASEFAKSPNSKVVVMGGGQGPLPMILNLGESAPPSAGASSPETAESPPTPAPKRPAPAKAGTVPKAP